MDMNGEYQIAAPRQRVWEALNDPEILRHCIPGCEEIVKVSDVEWTAKVTAKVGPVKAKFGGKVTLSDLDPPNGYTITGEGTGGAAGFAKGGAAVKLVDQGAGTLLTYTVKAQVGGKLAQIGSRLIDGASRKMAEEFFGNFAAMLGAPPAEVGAGDGIETRIGEIATAEIAALDGPAPPEVARPAPVMAEPPRMSNSDRTGSRLSPLVWVGGLVIVVIVILIAFTR
jgi:carbon monoxide dehydrogenase subunit G